MGFADGEAAGVAEPDAGAVADADREEDPVGEGDGACFRASGTAIPFEEADGEGRTVAVLFDPFLALGVGLALGLPLGDGVPVGVGCAAAPTGSAASTARNCSWADCWTSASVVGSGLPGRSTMIFVSAPWPCRATSASEIPLPLTRCRMMLTDSSTAVGSTLRLACCRLGAEDDLRAALEVERELRAPLRLVPLDAGGHGAVEHGDEPQQHEQ